MTNDAVTLREYVDTRFDAQDRAVASALAAQEKTVAAALASADRAVSKAELASDKRFEGVNEFRQSLADQARLLMPRLEAEQIVKGLTEKLDALTARLNTRDDQGKGAGNLWGYIVGAVGLVATIAALVGMVTK